MKYEYDVVVIGGGGAGLTASKTVRGFGKKVALIEKTDRLGGECTWTGCVPSKTLVKTAAVAWQMRHGNRYGLSDAQMIDTTNIMKRVHHTIQQQYQYETPEKIEQFGIKVLFGNSRFIDSHSIDLNGKKVTFDKAIITTGSKPLVPPINGLDSVPFFTNETIFNIKQLPSSLLILGGGPIGCEMASALNRLGVKVTIIEMQERLLPKEDEEVVALLTDIMQQEGVQIQTGMKATKVMKKKDGIALQIEGKKSNTTVTAEELLVAVGRRPSIDGMNLDGIGVQTNKRGMVTDNTLRSTVNTIYAAGDVVGPYLFSHYAWYQGMIAARNACIPLFKKKVSYDPPSWATFTAPELGSLGLTEQAARDQYGDNLTIIKQPYDHLDRAITDQATQGLGKYILDKKGRLIGAHILGATAGELLAELHYVAHAQKRFSSIGSIVHVYPTYSELNWHAAKKAYIKELESKWWVKLARRFFLPSR